MSSSQFSVAGEGSVVQIENDDPIFDHGARRSLLGHS
jgi:hypothetical protein